MKTIRGKNKKIFKNKKCLLSSTNGAKIIVGQRVTGWLTSIKYEMGVMLMKNQFSFNDLMQFGLFILALLTFIFMNVK